MIKYKDVNCLRKLRIQPGHQVPILEGLFLVLAVLFLHTDVLAQACISGSVTDQTTGKPLQQVNIRLTGNRGTATGSDGRFELCGLPPGNTEIIFSFVGYRTLTEKITLKPGENKLGNYSLVPAPIRMDEVVVTATLTENRLLDAPVRVNVIGPKVIQQIPVQNVDDMLKYTAGVNYSRPFGIFSTKGLVTMRGLSGKEQGRVLVLLDGVPINKSDGGTVDWNMVDVNLVQRVEITKGAGSALYGGNAMGGTINIISKVPAEPLFLKASAEYGSFNTMGARINGGGVIKSTGNPNRFYWQTNLFYKKSDGYITQSEADRKANPYIVKSNMKEAGMNLKAGYTLGSRHSIEAMVNYYNDRRGTGEKVYQPEGNTTDHDSYGIILNYKGNLEKYKLRSSLYLLTENYKKVNEYLKDDYTWYNVLSKRRDLGWFSSLSAGLGKHQLFTGGVDIRNGGVDAYDMYYTSTDIVYNEGYMNSFALFAQDEVNLWGDKVRLIAGARYDVAAFYNGSFRTEYPSPETEFMRDYQVPDMPEQNWQALSPRISAQYKWSGTGRIYAQYSRGFRPSVLDDLCRSGRIKGGFKIANPSLKPEYLNNFETGADLQLFPKSRLSTSLYYSKGTDFQYYVSNGQTIDMGFGDRPIFIRANISGVEIYGAEVEINWEPVPLLTLFATYNYNRSAITDYHKIAGNDTIDLSGKHFTDVPDHLASAGASWTGKPVSISMLARYNGSMFINDQNVWDEILLADKYPAYTTIDLKIWKDLGRQYRVSLNVQNLADKKYYDSKYAVCPGRFITGEFSVQF